MKHGKDAWDEHLCLVAAAALNLTIAEVLVWAGRRTPPPMAERFPDFSTHTRRRALFPQQTSHNALL